MGRSLGPRRVAGGRNRTDGRYRYDALYSPSRGRDRRASQGPTARRSARAVLTGGPCLVRDELRGPDGRAGPWLGGHLGRTAHAHPRPDGEWQDPGRVPVVPGPARPRPQPATHAHGTRARPGPVHLAAQGAHLRHRAEPAGAADGHRAGRGAPRRRATAHQRRVADRRHARRKIAARSPADRRTSSSRPPNRSISCSRARRATRSGTSTT